MDSARRRLFFHGSLLFLLGLAEGGIIPLLAKPRLALSTHVGTLISGLFLIALGAVFSELDLSARLQRWVYWLALSGQYASCLAFFLAAAFGTNSITKINGGGPGGQPWQEAVVTVLFNVGGVAAVGCLFPVVWGLRGRGEKAGS